MKRSLVVAISVFFALFLIALPVIAYTWYAQLSITGGSTSYGMLPIVFPVDNDSLVDNGFMNSTANDTSVETLGGIEKPRMVTHNTTLTAVPVAAGSQTNLYYTTGNTATETMDIIFGYGGYATMTDASSAEPSNNGTISLTDTWLDTTAGAGKIIVDKLQAIGTFVSPTVSGNITTTITNIPAVAATNSSAVGVANVNHTVNLPAGISAGNLLIVGFSTVNGVTVTFPAGWTNLVNTTFSNVQLVIKYKIADGTEGASITVTTNVASESAHLSYRITGHDGIVQAGTSATGNSANPNPPSVTPSWGSANTLWLPFSACNGIINPSHTGYPASYTNGYQINTNTGVPDFSIGSARRTLTAVSEDPGTFTLAAVYDWVSNTVAVKPLEDSVTATGVTSAEHDFSAGIESPFLWQSIDASSPLPPVANGLVLNAPLWQVECSADPFTSIDTNAYSLNPNGAVWTVDGYDFESADTSDTIDPGFEPGALSAFTVEAWAKYETSGIDHVIWHTTATNDDRAISLRSNGVEIETGGAVGLQSVWHAWSFGNIPAGVWHHVVLTYDGSNIRAYYDGALDGSPTPATGTLNAAGQNSQIGSYNAFQWWMDGLIGEVRLYGAALSASQVLQNYNATKTKYGVTGNIWTYSTLATVPNNSNAWQFGSANTTPRIGSYKHYVNGNLIVWYEPNTIILGGTYSTGTVTVTNGDATVTGAGGASWTSNLAGSIFRSADGADYVVSSVTNTTSLELTTNYAGGTLAGQTYTMNARLPDRQGTAQDGRITWGTNPTGVSVSLGSMVSASQPTPGSSDDEPPPEVLPTGGNTDFHQEPNLGSLATNPLRPFVQMVSDNTTISELQAWRFMGLIFVVFITVLTARSVRGHHFITGIACGGSIVVLVVWTVWPLYTLVMVAVALLAGMLLERSPSI